MMNTRFLRYSAVLTIPAFTIFSIYSQGWLTFSTVIFAYLMVPAMEFLFSRNTQNLDEHSESELLNDRKFDYIVYAMVPVQYIVLALYLMNVQKVPFASLEFFGMSASMGVTCGVIGINVAHELGHRKSAFERFLAKSLLLTSLYMHFIIEHNKGHHKYVATPQDPASARRGETVHQFWFRSGVMSYLSAWRLEAQRLSKKGVGVFSLQNEMLRFQILQVAMLVGIYLVLGWPALLGFWLAAIVGILQLETVNYIEHYGLLRKQTDVDRYERVQPWHSWNSDHMVGRLMLFELSRHSDHHYLASRKYQILRHHDDSPQMPTGYPGMMLLSLVPPLWFKVMNHKLEKVEMQFSSQ